MTEFVAITNQRHAKAETGQCSKKPDDSSLAKKNPNDLPDVRAEGFHDSNFAALLHGDGDERAHDPERGHNDKEENKKEHDRPFETNCFEKLTVHIDPRFGELRNREKTLDFILHAFGAVRIVCFDRDAVQRIPEIVEFLSDINRHQKKFGIVLKAAGLENAGYGQLFWQDDLAQFIDCFLFFVALRVL